MKKIAFICPYFGTLPQHCQLWLNSCAFNKDITWFLITDDKRAFDYPENVKVIYTTLADLKAEYQNKFDFPISLEGTYKLGDFKPLYGYLYEDTLLKGYDAWGHIDVADEIYGDIRKFVTDELLDEYDKLMVFGHMCIYKNTPEVNRRFMEKSDSNLTYKHIFSSTKFFNFEEIASGSITRIYMHNNYPIGRMDEHFADISGIYYAFRLGKWNGELTKLKYYKRVPLIFSWENGKAYGYSIVDGEILKKEYLYVHFKRRRMGINVPLDAKEYLIVPSGFEPKNGDIDKAVIKKYSKDKLFYDVFFKEKKKAAMVRWKQFVNKFIMGGVKTISRPFFAMLPPKAFVITKYYLYNHKWLNLKNPQTYNEKLNWLKLYDHNPLYTTLVDKYLVKDYVAERIGKEHIIPTLGHWDSFDEIDFDKLPNQFVLKTNHDSGGVVICKDKATFDKKAAKKKLMKSLKHDYYRFSKEWPYKNVKRQILAEQYMEDESGFELKDYKWFCFDGDPKALYIGSDRQVKEVETKFDFFDADFKHLPIVNGHPNAILPISKPNGFEKMKELARILSNGLPHVRIDFYDVNGQIYFGEMTFYHNSGFSVFEPDSWDKTFGSWIKLPTKM